MIEVEEVELWQVAGGHCHTSQSVPTPWTMKMTTMEQASAFLEFFHLSGSGKAPDEHEHVVFAVGMHRLPELHSAAPDEHEHVVFAVGMHRLPELHSAAPGS